MIKIRIHFYPLQPLAAPLILYLCCVSIVWRIRDQCWVWLVKCMRARAHVAALSLYPYDCFGMCLSPLSVCVCECRVQIFKENMKRFLRAQARIYMKHNERSKHKRMHESHKNIYISSMYVPTSRRYYEWTAGKKQHTHTCDYRRTPSLYLHKSYNVL